MTVPATILRGAIAAVGIACLGPALGAVRASRTSRLGSVPRRWPLEPFVVAVARRVRPLALHSEILRRPSVAAGTRKRIALTADTSWVSRSAITLAHMTAEGRFRLQASDERTSSEADRIVGAMAALRAAHVVIGTAAVLPAALLGGAFLGCVAACAAIGSALLPDVALAQHARRAGGRVDGAMPAALELLAACCRGGIALESALAVTAAHANQPLRGVLDRARQRQRAGEAPATALRLEAEAVGVDEVSALGRLVDRHHQLGLPLEGPLLARAQAARARARIAALGRAGRGVPVASLLLATVIAPCCVGILATWVILALIGQAGPG